MEPVYLAQADEMLPDLIQTESGGDPGAVSPKGAFGVGQAMPATAANPGYGVRPMQNRSVSEQRRFARDYLAAMLERYGGDPVRAAAAYNAGPGRVDKAGGVPNIAETQNYVRKVGLPHSKGVTAAEIGLDDDLQDLSAHAAPAGVTAAEIGLDEIDHAPAQTGGDYNPVDDMSGFDRFAAGAGKAIYDTGRGAGQLLRKALPDSAADYMGLPTQADIDNAKRLDAPLMNTGAGIAGNIAGNVAAIMLPGGAAKAAGQALNAPKLLTLGNLLTAPDSIRKGAAVGAGLSAMQPTGSDESKLMQAAYGAAGGGLGSAIPKSLSRVLSPKTREEAKLLIDAGVTPTPGQILGGAYQRLEDGATSIPFVGDAIKGAQRRAVEGFNVAAYNRALNEIGSSFDNHVPVGHEGLTRVADEISAAYDNILPTLKIRQDAQFHADIGSLRNLAKNMPEAKARQFENILHDALLGRFARGGGMRGETMQEANSKLGQEIRLYSGSSDPDNRKLADALKEARATFERLVERSNPDKADTLKGINRAWANLARLEDAGSRVGAKDGVFSPAQLKSAARAGDKTVRKRGYAQGKALLQDLAEAGQSALGQTVPDSGTPFRLGAMAPLGATYMASPDAAIAALAASGIYTPTGQTALKYLLTSRPNSARSAARLIDVITPKLSTLGAASSPYLSQKD